MSKLAVDLFAGVGGATSALVKSGFNVISIEKSGIEKVDDGNTLIHHLNFLKHLFINQFIQDWQYCGVDRQVDHLHFSPPCQSFSVANANAETDNDIMLAVAIANIIADLDPVSFTLEQVPGYLKSKSFEIISEAIAHYTDLTAIINLKDYGHAQNRRRLFIAGHKSRQLRLPDISPFRAWSSCFDVNDPNALLIDPYKPLRRKISSDRPFPTILRSYFVDKKKGRKKDGSISIAKRENFLKYISHGQKLPVPFSALAIACGFPDDYKWTGDILIDGGGIGNAFSPLFLSSFLEVNDL